MVRPDWQSASFNGAAVYSKIAQTIRKEKAAELFIIAEYCRPSCITCDPAESNHFNTYFQARCGCRSITAGAYMWALIPETVEYGEYKTGKRMGGLIYAVIGFFFKFGMALGGIVPGLVLDRFGYIANQVQTPEALLGILITTTVIPVCLLILAMVDINFYNLDEEKHKKVIRELENRDKVYIDHMDDFKM